MWTFSVSLYPAIQIVAVRRLLRSLKAERPDIQNHEIFWMFGTHSFELWPNDDDIEIRRFRVGLLLWHSISGLAVVATFIALNAIFSTT